MLRVAFSPENIEFDLPNRIESEAVSTGSTHTFQENISKFIEMFLTRSRIQGSIISTFHEMRKPMLKSDNERLDVSAMFKALGDPTRLHILAFLRSCCGPVAVEDTGDVRPVVGPTVGEVCCHVTGAEQINSKISHHLKELRLAGLITIEQRGKNRICGVNREAVAVLASYLSDAGADLSNSGRCC